jgi:hypothetical protein
MAQTINIGNQTNDGTGDSIRDAFRKVNENFQELYGVNNLGAGLFFTKLKDTPKQLLASSTTTPTVIVVDNYGNTVTQKLLVAGEGISISNTNSGAIVITNPYSSLVTDAAPRLGANMDGNGYKGVNFANPTEPADLVTKQYADNNSPYSLVNYYVSTSGRDTFPPDISREKQGRSLAYAFRTIAYACERAEEIISTSTLELSSYQQLMTLNNGVTTATVYSTTASTAIPGNIVVKIGISTYAGTDQFIQENIKTGQYLQGVTSDTVAFIETLGQINGKEFYDVNIRSGPGFILGEALLFSYQVSNKNITIFVESGEYYEHLPIRVPANVSIRGDEFRRCIIRPRPGVSQSKWANIWFRRDSEFDGLTKSSNNGTTLLAPMGQLFGYHYLTDPADVNSTPRLNEQMDVFLMNDAGILRAISVHNHGGFMCVLDPEGQIRTKSPYIQNCSSFSSSINAKQFAGGIYADGFSGNLQVNPSDASSYFTGTTTIIVTGLDYREPQTPTSFYVKGNRYEVDYVTTTTTPGTITLHLNTRNAGGIAFPNSTIAINDGIGYSYAPLVIFDQPITNGGYPAQGTANLSGGILTSVTITNPGSGYTGTVQVKFIGGNPITPAGTYTIPSQNIKIGFVGILPSSIELGTAGNKSILSADFTQINDLGYGYVGVNNAFMECVSDFSYYAQVSYYSKNGTNIRSLNGSSVYGKYALVSEGSDPNQVPIPVYLSDDMVQTGTVVSYNYSGAGINTVNTGGSTTLYIRGYSFLPYNQSEIEIDHGLSTDSTGNILGLQTYSVVSASTVTNASLTGINDLAVLNLSNANVFGSTAGGLKAPVTSSTIITIRSVNVFNMVGINPETTFSGAPALQYLESTSTTYHILGYDFANVTTGTSKLTIREDFGFIPLQTYNSSVASGSSTIPILNLTTATAARITGSTGSTVTQLTFAWGGGIYRITDYTNSATISQPYDRISISPNLGSTVTNATGASSVLLKAGLRAYSPAQITNAISLLRVTNHDLVDVGAGSYYESRVPSNVFGPHVNAPTPANERTERGTGRIFAVTNDQNGNFKVGDYFQVNQASGDLTIKASLNLTQVSGLGFKRGVVVTAFDQDGNMTDNSNTAVPTQQAVISYINYRLGLNSAGTSIGAAKIGPGYLDLTGVQSMLGSIDMAGHTINMNSAKIINLNSCTNSTDAAPKIYADQKISLAGISSIDPATSSVNATFGQMTGALQLFRDPTNTDASNTAATMRYVDKVRQLSTLSDVTLVNPQDKDFLMFNATTVSVNTTSSTPVWNATRQITNVAVTATSDIAFARTGNRLAVTIVANTITNTQINSNAAIAQSKLNMNKAVTLSTSTAIDQSNLGLAVFDSRYFNSVNGFISLASAGNFPINVATANQVSHTLSVGGYLSGSDFNGSGDTTWSVDASSSNSAGRIVARDSSGNFAAGTITLSAITKSGSSGSGDIGQSGNTFGTVYASTFNGVATSALYADLAENYLADAEYAPGTVLEFGGDKEVTLAEDSTCRIAGVVSTNPAHLMNSGLVGTNVVAVALMGRIPCKVRGKIRKGDMMVSGGDGYARPERNPLLGSVIGKALEDFDGVSGIIEIVVGRL